MKRNQVSGRPYSSPPIQINCFQHESRLLAASPQVQPGGGGSGNIGVKPLDPDEEEVAGAKPWSGWLWEEKTNEK